MGMLAMFGLLTLACGACVCLGALLVDSPHDVDVLNAGIVLAVLGLIICAIFFALSLGSEPVQITN